MSHLSMIREWIATFPDYDILASFQVDYTDQIPSNGGIFPAGHDEISRTTDILGNTTVVNQENFGIYVVFDKTPGDNVAAADNQEWIAEFQEWVQEQSVKGEAPVFGDVPYRERIIASNGALYAATDEGLGTYMVQLSVRYVRRYDN